MLFLKQSTASQSVVIGPFVDSTDGNTAETGLTVSAADIRLSKNGANIVGKNSGDGTHDELGYYTITLDATDTDTVGRLQLLVHESGALPVYHEFWVLEEVVYDALFGASAAGYGTAQTGDSFARLGAPAGASVSADIAAIEAQTDDIGASGAGLAAIPWNASWDAEVQSEVADALAVYDPPTHAELTSEINDVQTDVAAVQSDTNDIQTRIPAALASGNMKSDVLALNGSTAAAALLAILNGSTVVYQGTVTGAATTTTLIDSALTQADTDWWKGRIIIFTSVITLQATDITGFDPATDKLTFTAVTAAPTAATYIII